MVLSLFCIPFGMEHAILPLSMWQFFTLVKYRFVEEIEHEWIPFETSLWISSKLVTNRVQLSLTRHCHNCCCDSRPTLTLSSHPGHELRKVSPYWTPISAMTDGAQYHHSPISKYIFTCGTQRVHSSMPTRRDKILECFIGIQSQLKGGWTTTATKSKFLSCWFRQ